MEDELVEPLKYLLEWYRGQAADDLIDQADDDYDEALAYRMDDRRRFPVEGEVRDAVGEALWDVFVERMEWVKPRDFPKYIHRHTLHGRIEDTTFRDDAIATDAFRDDVDRKVVDELETYFKDYELSGDEMRCLRDFVEDWVGQESFIDIMAGDDSAEEREREAYDFTRTFIEAICN